MEKAGQRLPISAGRKSTERASDSRLEINIEVKVPPIHFQGLTFWKKKFIWARPDLWNTCF